MAFTWTSVFASKSSVANDCEQTEGVLSFEQFFAKLSNKLSGVLKGRGMLEHISQILKAKGSKVWCIAPDATVYDALAMMADKGVGALVVLQEGRVVGIFGERDFVLKVDLCGLSAQTTLVGQVMSKDIYYASPGTTIDEAMAIVTESHHRHLPVIENEQLVGLVSIGDLVKASLDKKDFVIKQLTKYIKGEL